MKNLLDVCRMSWIMEWYYVHFCLRFILTVENNSHEWVQNDAQWIQTDVTGVSGACPFIYWHVPLCTMYLQRWRVLLCLNGYQLVHMAVCKAAIILQSKSIKLFRDSTTGPSLSLTKDHVCLSHSLDFGWNQWSRCMGTAFDCVCCFCWLSWPL